MIQVRDQTRIQGQDQRSGIGHLVTHAFRHTYRSWLDAAATPIAIQQKLMRHSGES